MLQPTYFAAETSPGYHDVNFDAKTDAAMPATRSAVCGIAAKNSFARSATTLTAKAPAQAQLMR
jgi:hypothetical protein